MSHRAHCPRCAATDLLVVGLVPVDKPMRFTTCRACEHRWWEDVEAGTGSTLGSVIHELSAAG